MVHSQLSTFRQIFKLPDRTVLQWFPGHMGKGLKQMKQKLKSVDCIIEVHDARIPFSGRNPNFKGTVCGSKPHVLVLSKKDLSDLTFKNLIIEKLKKNDISNVVFSNCKEQKCPGMAKIVPLTKELISSSPRYNREGENSFSVMVVGVPNVGKSSFINNLRSKYLKRPKASPVGAIAGITRSVLSQIKVCEDPLIYVYDTPGILTPNIPNTETGMKLALCSTMQDHLVGIELIADYLLYWMNKSSNFQYVDHLGLKNPCDNIREVLTLAAIHFNKVKRVSSVSGSGYVSLPDTDFAASLFVKAFRNGDFGKVFLDQDIL